MAPEVSSRSRPVRTDGRLTPIHRGAATADRAGSEDQPRGSRATPLERWLVGRMLRALGRPAISIVLWDGSEHRGSSQPSVARVVLRDRRTLWRLVARPEMNFGEDYMAGRIEVEGDLLPFLETVYRASWPQEAASGILARIGKWMARHSRSNSRHGSRANIHHHYDIGNDFYRLWLDRELLYTCAYFPSPNATLEQAQVAKMDLICRKLWLRPGETVIETGCGWGALALYMARHYGASVKAYNVSREQIKYARQRARAEGLADRVEFIEDDYRNAAGRFEAFASVGMLEHVGPAHYRELGRVIDRCLSPTGRGLIHTIGRDVPGPVNAWIRRRIFPGAYPPTLREITDVLQPQGLSVLDLENLRLHYAETLRHWWARFEASADQVTAMFDPAFIRAWRLYLAGSMAGFTTGSLQLFQILFTRHALNDIPWTRRRLFRENDEARMTTDA